jgi:hypothetical protein
VDVCIRVCVCVCVCVFVRACVRCCCFFFVFFYMCDILKTFFFKFWNGQVISLVVGPPL